MMTLCFWCSCAIFLMMEDIYIGNKAFYFFVQIVVNPQQTEKKSLLFHVLLILYVHFEFYIFSYKIRFKNKQMSQHNSLLKGTFDLKNNNNIKKMS